MASEYLASAAPEAAIEFVRATGMGRESRPRSLYGKLRDLLGNVPHLWMWDAESLTVELKHAGFPLVQQKSYGNWSDPRFADVEVEDRLNSAFALEASCS